ncbi:MAG TPA: AAA family ATPase [Acetobacteraceae bacterium]
MQQDVVAFLSGLTDTEPVETHISLVFVGADTVWKLKKAVRLPFLDFTDVAARRHFAERELVLNGPAAAGLYRDVVAVVRQADGRLGFGDIAVPGTEVIDWVLRMARIPKGDFLDAMAAAAPLEPKMLDALADAVAAYHAHCPIADMDVAGSMRDVTRGNARSARHAGLPSQPVAEWERAVSTALDSLSAWQQERARGGFVRRAHGDLHLGNLCLWRGRPVPFDALEFDERMATIDLGYDVAFLLMDLDQRASLAAANRVFNRYIARRGDAGFIRALPAYLSQRAMILAHVHASRGNPERSQSYLKAALDYMRPAPSVMVAIGGLQGTGKSTLGRALAPTLGRAPGALMLRSDEIRKRLHGAPPEQRLPAGAYTDAASAAVFASLAEAARETAAAGHAVVADATFIDPAHRWAVREAARLSSTPFVGIWLEAPLPVLEARLAARTADASDATAKVLRASARVRTIPPRDWHILDATDPALLARAHDLVRTALSLPRPPC